MNSSPISPENLAAAELASLLHFYADSGVEWLLEDAPVDRIAVFAEQKASHAAAARQQPHAATATAARQAPAADPSATPLLRSSAPAAAVAVPDADAVAAARFAADGARSLDELKTALEAFNGCNLKHGARSTVFASGDPTTGIMVIGPMPSADDDRDGLPFSGRQGQLLDRMLAAIGLSRQGVLLTNVVPWRPPGNRIPSPAEIEICRPFIERQVTLVEPRLLLLLGNFTARFFLESETSIFGLRGQWRDLSIGGRSIPALASLHPQDLLTAPANKALVWQDLLLFRQALLN
ncbi:uracil-DNA glycosylase [Rhizobium sp. 0TCS1.26]|uniref:uracil-DNA glycosylase n=1 Tax=Rhizobium sp. 0TCS1.26 TaxID=3142623 RepID=UPI003D2BE1A8